MADMSTQDEAMHVLLRLAARTAGASRAALREASGRILTWPEGAARPSDRAILAGGDPDARAIVAPLPQGALLAAFGDAPLDLDAAARRDFAALADLAAAGLAVRAAPSEAVRALARFKSFRLDRASGAIQWSDEALSLLGVGSSAEPPSYASFLAAFAPPAQTEIRACVARCWESDAEISIAAAMTRRIGGRRDVMLRMCAEPPGPDGRRTALVGVLIDVTDARAFDERLEREREFLRTTLDHMDQGLIVVEPDLSVPVLSRRVAELLDLPEAFVETHPTFPEILNFQLESGRISRDAMNAAVQSMIMRGEPMPEAIVYERETPDGRTLEVRTSGLPSGGFVRTYTDQTARRRRDEAIARAEAEYRILFENSVIGIYRSTIDGRMIRANPALVRLNGYDVEAEMLEAVTERPGDWFVDPADGAEFLRRLERDGRVENFTALVIRHKTREPFWSHQTAWALRDASGAIVAIEGTVEDATERKRAEARIAHMATHDPLTGLANRAHLTDRLVAALAARPAHEPLALLLFDLDRFKAVNDTLGHMAGDALLRTIAGRLRALVGPGAVAARFGGDEFAVFVPGADREAAAELAERILAAARAPVPLEAGREVAVAASVGVALVPEHGLDPSDLLKRADVALYRAKAEGRDAWRVFAPEMDASIAERRRLEIDLRAALEREDFALIYQPVVRAADGAVMGHEALLRWTHPQHGPVPPERFIAVAEETRMIGPIGAWALARACREAAAWSTPHQLWVNVSAVQLVAEGFEAELAEALARSGFPPDRLVLEVTETALMDRRDEIAPRLARLRAGGVRVALDDFGTGYSSLSYLRRFRFDVLKLDRSFVRDLDEADTVAIVTSVLDLARRLGIATVAEGVETEAQLAVLRRAGCDMLQGHLFGQPSAHPDVAA
jgi:diguanylate cyclase (GGDEF)-like protein/PAS domain S-box-containing protein